MEDIRIRRFVKLIYCILFSGIGMFGMYGQTPSTITVVLDGDRGSNQFLELVQTEIDILLQDYDLTYTIKKLGELDQSPQEVIREGFADESQIVITLGFTASSALGAMNSFPKPSIAGFSLQRLNAESTGIDNYTFIQSPFSIQQDFETFQSITPFKHLGVFILPAMQSQVSPYLRAFANGFDIQFIPISNDVDYDMQQLNSNIDAIYVLPNLYNTIEQHTSLITQIKEANLPSFSLVGRNDVSNGVLASIAPSNYFSVYARRIALNVMKIFEGQNPKDFPIQITGVENDFVINVETMEQLEIFPPFDVLSQASLINLEPKIGIEYSLESAIAQAIQHNLSYQSAERNVDLQKTEIGIARSNVLPDLTASTNVVTLDGSTAEFLKVANQLTPQTEWTGNLELTQLIYSQPAWANVAIQKALLRSEEMGLLSQQLDLVQDVCTGYINLLLAQANLNIQNSNIQTTLSNLKIAKTKAKIGTVSNADVYGFESQLAQNKTLMNDARTGREQARIAFNQLLNRPLDEEFVLTDIKDKTDLLFLQDKRIFDRINNHYDFRKFADFLINYAFENAPEIEQLDWVIRAQEQSLQSNKLSRFLPQIGLQGSWNKSLGRYGTRTSDETFQALGVDPAQPTWNVGVNASLPIFQGFLRNKRIQKDKISIDQLRINKDLLKQSFATNIRISLENLGNSYNDIQFTQQAQEASGKYLKMVQDLYREGAINIVTLLDAQNNALGAQLGAISSRYQFINDAIIIERLFNNIYILKNQDERESFINEYLTYLIKKITMNKLVIACSVLCILFLSACGGSEKDTNAAQSIRPVKYINVGQSDRIGKHSYTGLAKAQQEANLSFKVGGTLNEIPVKVGDLVKKGQVLARLDATDYKVNYDQSVANDQNSKAQIGSAEAQLENAKSNLKTARSNYKRFEKLYETNSISISDFEQAKSSFLSAEASFMAAEKQVEAAKAGERSSSSMVRSASNQVNYTQLKAPFSGIISRINVEENEVVGQGSPVVEINSVSNPDVEIGVPENAISEIKAQQKVKVQFRTLHEKMFDGVVHEIGYSSNASTYPVTIRLIESDDRIRPGMPANAVFSFDDHHTNTSALLVPPSAVGEDNEGNFVYTLEKEGENYLCKKKIVKIGELSDNGFEIISGLTNGEKVAAAGLNVLRDGMLVSLYQKK